MKCIVICHNINRALCPWTTPNYNDRVALPNWYLRAVLEMLPYATFWRHKGLCKPNVLILCRDGIHLNHKGQYALYRSYRVPFYALWEIFPFLFTQRGSANPTSSLCQVAVTPPCFGLSTCRNIYGTSTSTFLWHHSMFLAAALHNYVALPNMLSSFLMIERLSPLICFPMLNHFGSVRTCWVYWATFHIWHLFGCFRYFCHKIVPGQLLSVFLSVPPLW